MFDGHFSHFDKTHFPPFNCLNRVLVEYIYNPLAHGHGHFLQDVLGGDLICVHPPMVIWMWFASLPHRFQEGGFHGNAPSAPWWPDFTSRYVNVGFHHGFFKHLAERSQDKSHGQGINIKNAFSNAMERLLWVSFLVSLGDMLRSKMRPRLSGWLSRWCELKDVLENFSYILHINRCRIFFINSISWVCADMSKSKPLLWDFKMVATPNSMIVFENFAGLLSLLPWRIISPRVITLTGIQWFFRGLSVSKVFFSKNWLIHWKESAPNRLAGAWFCTFSQLTQVLPLEPFFKTLRCLIFVFFFPAPPVKICFF